MIDVIPCHESADDQRLKAAYKQIYQEIKALWAVGTLCDCVIPQLQILTRSDTEIIIGTDPQQPARCPDCGKPNVSIRFVVKGKE